MQQQKPAYRPTQTTGFFCPSCGAPIYPAQRLAYPAAAVGLFAPVYRCSCGKHIGEPLSMVQLAKQTA